MNSHNKINVFGTVAFTSRFMPTSVSQQDSIRYNYDRLLITRIEDMYPRVEHNVPPSRSLNDVILCITDGVATMNIGAESYTAVKRNILYIPAGQVFSFEKYIHSKYTKGFLIVLNRDMLIGERQNKDRNAVVDTPHLLGGNLMRMGNESFSFIEQLLDRILKEHAENGMVNIELLRSYLVALIHEVRSKSKLERALQKSVSVKLVGDFIAMVTAHFKVKRNVNEYAYLLNVSPNHLSKVVKKFTDQSPNKWIDEALLSEAKGLLFQTNLTTNEIAEELGFNDPSYFCRLFRKYEGISPLLFRKIAKRS